MTAPKRRADARQTTRTAGRASVVIDHIGARLRSIRVDGVELLVQEGDEALLWGCYPMVPWAGRVNRGRFSFGGSVHQLPVNLGMHAIHGVGVDRSWAVGPDGAFELEMTDPWPFGGVARVSADLSPEQLTITLSVTAGERSMPAVIGWHPVFAKSIGDSLAVLDFRPGRILTRDHDGIPTGDLDPVPPGPWDDCFVGVSAPLSIRWGDDLRLTLDSPTDTWVVYDETRHAICVEPQTAIPDAFNRPDCPILEPGETLTMPLTIRW